jgi:hypothetical protein
MSIFRIDTRHSSFVQEEEETREKIELVEEISSFFRGEAKAQSHVTRGEGFG